MGKAERSSNRKTREQLSKRIPKLGYYFIVTDTKETEQNYMHGLRDSIPQSMRDNIVIKVVKAKTVDLVDKAVSLAALNPQYSEAWIVFDRDQVKNFDAIIEESLKKGLHVGWSNPCIEIWFHAYFGTMPSFQTSVACCNGFETIFEKSTGQKYDKSDKEIYDKLCLYGNEGVAISLALQKQKELLSIGKTKPSDMIPCTMVYELIDEIKSKIG